MKKAFTLVELIVVVGIIGLLTAVLIAGFSGSTESARAVKCLSNMRTLAMSATNTSGTGIENDRALASERSQVSAYGGTATTMFWERKGWVSADTKGFYTIWSSYHEVLYAQETHAPYKFISLYETDFNKGQHAITNGWMFARVGGNREVFVCPSHRKNADILPLWSYVMRSDHYCDSDTAAESTLAFAEVQFLKTDLNQNGLKRTETSTDGVLQSDSDGEMECIGCNHKVGKNLMAHVAFFDGHTEKLRVDGLSNTTLKELTEMLCEGKVIGRNGNRYEEIE